MTNTKHEVCDWEKLLREWSPLDGAPSLPIQLLQQRAVPIRRVGPRLRNTCSVVDHGVPAGDFGTRLNAVKRRMAQRASK